MRHTKIKVAENKRKAIFRNASKSKYDISRIDGCLIREGIRSDYLVTKCDVASAFVELKGADVAHACDQLLASAEHPALRGLIENKIGFLVVCSKYPRFDSFVAKAKQKCKDKFSAGFHVVVDKGEFDIERVAAIDGPW